MNRNSSLCPPKIVESLERYTAEGIPPGGFLRAVLENDLATAFRSADEVNLEMLPHIVAYIWNEVPASAWGSRANVNAWLNAFNERQCRDATTLLRPSAETQPPAR